MRVDVRQGSLALAMTLLSCATAAPPPSAPSPLVGHEAPNIDRRALDGAPVSTAALRGRTVLVEFFAEHCKPCMKSLPAIERLRQSLPELTIVAVSEDEDPGVAERLKSQLELGFPVVHDAGRVIAGRYRVSDLPATFVIDAAGKVRWRGDRAHDADELRAVIDAIR